MLKLYLVVILCVMVFTEIQTKATKGFFKLDSDRNVRYDPNKGLFQLNLDRNVKYHPSKGYQDELEETKSIHKKSRIFIPIGKIHPHKHKDLEKALQKSRSDVLLYEAPDSIDAEIVKKIETPTRINIHNLTIVINEKKKPHSPLETVHERKDSDCQCNINTDKNRLKPDARCGCGRRPGRSNDGEIQEFIYKIIKENIDNKNRMKPDARCGCGRRPGRSNDGEIQALIDKIINVENVRCGCGKQNGRSRGNNEDDDIKDLFHKIYLPDDEKKLSDGDSTINISHLNSNKFNTHKHGYNSKPSRQISYDNNISYINKLKKNIVENVIRYIRTPNVIYRGTSVLTPEQQKRINELKLYTHELNNRELGKLVYNIIFENNEERPEKESNGNFVNRYPSDNSGDEVLKQIYRTLIVDPKIKKKNKVMPMTKQQKMRQYPKLNIDNAKVVPKAEPNVENKGAWRRSLGSNLKSYGAPFQLQIEGLGQLNP